MDFFVPSVIIRVFRGRLITMDLVGVVVTVLMMLMLLSAVTTTMTSSPGPVFCSAFPISIPNTQSVRYAPGLMLPPRNIFTQKEDEPLPRWCCDDEKMTNSRLWLTKRAPDDTFATQPFLFRRVLSLRAGVSENEEIQSLSRDDMADLSSKAEDPYYSYDAEVVGASGRIGSFFLLNCSNKSIAVPRGIAPGYLSKAGSPIYVATPSNAWKKLFEMTPVDRRQDLVFLGNGLLPTESSSAKADHDVTILEEKKVSHSHEDCTVLVPHFGVLQKCTTDMVDPPITTSAESPPSILYGKHAQTVKAILESHGVKVSTVGSYQDIRQAAARKLIWTSVMWLVCHMNMQNDEENERTDMDEPLTVTQAHEQRQPIIDKLIEELLPVLTRLTGEAEDSDSVLSYILAYSKSMPSAIPSKALALQEVRDRNGVWWKHRQAADENNSQKLHSKLLQQVTGWSENDLHEKLEPSTETVSLASSSISIELPDVHLACSGKARVSDNSLSPPKRIVIIGSGVMGCSVATSLARQFQEAEATITVVDSQSKHQTGVTTPASWAWLNANNKQPKFYQWLNQLGLHAWKWRPDLAKLVSWTGSIVRFPEPPAFVNEGGYPLQGPLNSEQLNMLEPQADFPCSQDEKENTPTFFFPDEGLVDPADAMRTLRQSAQDLGIEFVFNYNVTTILKDAYGAVSGVECTNTETRESMVLGCDVIVVAAGVGAAANVFGELRLPLLHKPGQLAFYKAENSRAESCTDCTNNNSLSKILVDSIRSSHVLQRKDGTLVAGGGAFVTGGSSIKKTQSPPGTEEGQMGDEGSGEELMKRAAALYTGMPEIQNNAAVTTQSAVRPMPQDGIPVVGYMDNDSKIYGLVTHSGFTLGPVLGSMAAAEILNPSVSLDVLDPYRPQRFGDI